MHWRYTGATAHTHKDKDLTTEVDAVQSKVRDSESGNTSDMKLAKTCQERQLDNFDPLMVDYRHPPLFTHEHGCVT